MKKILTSIATTLALFKMSFLTVLAQFPGTPSSSSGSSATTFNANNPLVQFIGLIQTVVNRLVPVTIGIAVLAFFWFLIKYITKGSENEKERTEGLKGMGWSILALFVMVSIWGIILMLAKIFDVQVGGSIPALKLPGQS
ncbi:MAG: hypothetical protein RI935_648 [Candidatus Parcubacteria bacterium]|jgi:hypothetical protein